jgi:hypothetical protein
MVIGEYSKPISFFIIEIARFDVILGKAWLKLYNPDVDWEYDQIHFRGRCRRDHCEPSKPIEVMLLEAGDWVEEWDNGEIVLAGLATPLNPKGLQYTGSLQRL